MNRLGFIFPGLYLNVVLVCFKLKKNPLYLSIEMKYLIYRIPSSIPWGGGERGMYPPPPCPLLREPWGWVPWLPVTIGNPFIQNAWLDPLNSECHWGPANKNTQQTISFFQIFFFLPSKYNQIWVELNGSIKLNREKKSLVWPLGFASLNCG